jgi:hypothetical protein
MQDRFIILGVTGYALKPYDRYYELYEWRGVKRRESDVVTEKWISCECFPSTLDHALEMVLNRLLLQKLDSKTLEELERDVIRIIRLIHEARRELSEY